MKAALKLFASLSDYLPAEARRSNRIDLELEPGTTVEGLIERYRLPPGMCHLILVDGVFVPRAACASRVLGEGEVLAIWPPVAGG